MNALNTCFQEALCTEPVPVGLTVHCQCGGAYKSTLEEPKFIGSMAGVSIVKGCECDATGSFGNMWWQYRHVAAQFFRLMAKALAADSARLIDTLPPAMGNPKDWTGLVGQMEGGEAATCALDTGGHAIDVVREGRRSRETVKRSMFRPNADQV